MELMFNFIANIIKFRTSLMSFIMSSVTNALQLQQKFRSCTAFIKIMF
jgi:hypothetical protein